MEQPCDCQDKNVFVYHDPIQNSNAPEMVPVVIAAALPASASIQNSLESAMQLVKESLSTAVPRIRKSLTEDFSSKKRPKAILMIFLQIISILDIYKLSLHL